MAYDKSLLSYDPECLIVHRKTESSGIPNTECNGKNAVPSFRPCFPVIGSSETSEWKHLTWQPTLQSHSADYESCGIICLASVQQLVSSVQQLVFQLHCTCISCCCISCFMHLHQHFALGWSLLSGLGKRKFMLSSARMPGIEFIFQ